MERLLNAFVIVLMVIILLLGAYIIYDSHIVTSSAELGLEIKQYAPIADDFDFEKWQSINPKIVGWIKIDDTNIDYPILQGEDNDYYLSRNYRDEFATAGSIFLDYRNNMQSDVFLIVYGHRMSMGKMFTDVTKYVDRSFFDSHRNGLLYDKTGLHKMKAISFAKIRADTKVVYGNITLAAVDFLRMNSLYWIDDVGRRYVLLSTCDATDKSLRDVLLFTIERI